MVTLQVREAIGCSPKSWEDAVNEAIKKMGKEAKNIRGVDVKGLKAKVENGKIVEYRANVKIAVIV